MKILPLFILAVLFGGLPTFVSAQKQAITIMIFRHAEKEVPVEGDETEPDISIDGQKRAIRLAYMLRKYKPNRVLSTKYARTIQTVTPLARMTNNSVEIYEPGRLPQLAADLSKLTGKHRIAVGGHSNTSYQLVNLLIGREKYPKQAETDYGKLWIVTIRNGKITEKLIEY